MQAEVRRHSERILPQSQLCFSCTYYSLISGTHADARQQGEHSCLMQRLPRVKMEHTMLMCDGTRLAGV